MVKASAPILVVDNEPSNSQVVQKMLEYLGLTALTNSSGADALQTLKRQAVCAVITDFYMPHMNGAELCQEINRQYPGLPVIIMSGTLADAQTSAAGLLVAGWLAKPFSLATITKVLEQAGITQPVIPA